MFDFSTLERIFFKRKMTKKSLDNLLTDLHCYVKDIFHIFFSEPVNLMNILTYLG